MWAYYLYIQRYFPTIPVTAWRFFKSVVVNFGSASLEGSSGFQRRCLKKSPLTAFGDFYNNL